jgi:pimeloyl-ACP methyl ester carboxylesterase
VSEGTPDPHNSRAAGTDQPATATARYAGQPAGAPPSDPGRTRLARPSRRAVLAAGAAGLVGLVAVGAGIEADVLPGRSELHRLLGLEGPPGTIPDVDPGRMTSGEFTSAARLGTRVGWSVAYPPDAPTGIRLPVLVVLHGRGGDHTHAFGTTLGLDRFLAQAVSRGVSPFAIASVDGGDTFWHRRSTGEDAGAMVTGEFLPLLRTRGLGVARVAFLGWSMGGYGSLLLASQLGPARVAAVVAESPAIWVGDAPRGPFDGPADSRANTVFTRQQALARIPLRIDCGTSDPFYSAAKAFVATLSPRPAGGFQPGGHDWDYWRRMAPVQLAFAGAHLARR